MGVRQSLGCVVSWSTSSHIAYDLAAMWVCVILQMTSHPIYIYTYMYIYSNSDLCGLNPDFWFSTHNSSWLSPCFCCLNAKLLRFKTTFWCLSRSHHSYFSSFSPTILWTMWFPHQKVVGGKFLPYMVSENRLYHLAIFLLKMGF